MHSSITHTLAKHLQFNNQCCSFTLITCTHRPLPPPRTLTPPHHRAIYQKLGWKFVLGLNWVIIVIAFVGDCFAAAFTLKQLVENTTSFGFFTACYQCPKPGSLYVEGIRACPRPHPLNPEPLRSRKTGAAGGRTLELWHLCGAVPSVGHCVLRSVRRGVCITAPAVWLHACAYEHVMLVPGAAEPTCKLVIACRACVLCCRMMVGRELKTLLMAACALT